MFWGETTANKVQILKRHQAEKKSIPIQANNIEHTFLFFLFDFLWGAKILIKSLAALDENVRPVNNWSCKNNRKL